MSRVAIDFDCTICDSHNPKKPPLAGAREAVSALREAGHYVIIHSCNSKHWIERWMANNDIRYDHIWTEEGKPSADLYVDDRGYRFYNWLDALTDIETLLGGRP